MPDTASIRVQPGSLLTLHYRLAGPDGRDVINTFGGKPATLEVGAGQLAPGIEARLVGLAEGARTAFTLGADEAFGARNPQLVHWVSRTLLAEVGDPEADYRIGDVVRFPPPAGAAPTAGGYAGMVRELRDDALLFDFNHPLAGQPVTFEVQLIGVL